MFKDDTDDFVGEIEAVQMGLERNAFEDNRMSHQDSIQLIQLIERVRKEF